MSHPVQYDIDPPREPRNRLTVAFRPILGIPHALFVGIPVLGIFGGVYRAGALGSVALLVAICDWVMILVRGQPIEELQYFKRLYLHWRARALAYFALLRDEYPPLGERSYPVQLALPDPPPNRDRLTVAFRLILVVPHLIVLALFFLAWVAVVIVSWFAILITGRLDPELWRFGRDVMQYSLRLEAYMLLVHDVYPPFALRDPASAPGPFMSQAPEPRPA